MRDKLHDISHKKKSKRRYIGPGFWCRNWNDTSLLHPCTASKKEMVSETFTSLPCLS